MKKKKSVKEGKRGALIRLSPRRKATVKKKLFRIFKSTKNDAQLVKVECPECKTVFGLDPLFMNNLSELNFKFTCPYCRYGPRSLKV